METKQPHEFYANKIFILFLKLVMIKMALMRRCIIYRVLNVLTEYYKNKFRNTLGWICIKTYGKLAANKFLSSDPKLELRISKLSKGRFI